MLIKIIMFLFNSSFMYKLLNDLNFNIEIEI